MSKPIPPRKRGRPAKAPADHDQRTRILDIATDLFSRQGISATSLSEIARRAQITPALMHYYFGNRESLLDALVAERLEPAVAAVSLKMAGAGEDLRELVSRFVRAMIAEIANTPWFPPLWVREVLSEGGLLRERLIGKIGSPLTLHLRNRFAEAQRKGELNRDLDPNLLVVSLISLTIFPFASASIWRGLFGADYVTPDIIVQHALALLDRGLELPK
jgi:AcrR family transcriptional regulator